MKLFTVIGISLISIGARGQDTTHAELLGKYIFPAGSVVENVIVMKEAAGLVMSSSAGDSPLVQVKGDTFNIVNFQGIAVFKRNEQQKISGIHVDASGYVLDGVRDTTATGKTMTGGGRVDGEGKFTLPAIHQSLLLKLEMEATEDSECAG
jgi:hypothetical protein